MQVFFYLFFVHVRWMHKQSRYRFQVGHNGTLSLECVTELKGDQGGWSSLRLGLCIPLPISAAALYRVFQ